VTARSRFWSIAIGTTLVLLGASVLLLAYQDELDADRPDPCGGA
jgi:hypothetical protein